MIKVSKYEDLDVETKILLQRFIDIEFGHIPIVKETKWAKPDWTIIYYNENQIITFYNIVERKVKIDNIELKIAGINNVMTPNEFRGKGYASKLMKGTEKLVFENLSCKFGLLLCADELIPFYERFGWHKIDCPVYFDQSGGEKLWTANTMLLTRDKKVFPNLINLNGLPW